MVKLNFKVEFPCGLKYHKECEGWIGVIEIPKLEEVSCPMHGKACKRSD